MAEITVQIEGVSEHLQAYSGEYSSDLEIDGEGMPQWKIKNGQKAIWMFDNLWRIGSLDNQGTAKSELWAAQGSGLCPYHIKNWQYDNGSSVIQAESRQVKIIKAGKESK